jgi:hypothetical protein
VKSYKGSITLPFPYGLDELLTLSTQVDNPAADRYLVKVPSKWWERLLGKDIIGQVATIHFAHPHVNLHIDIINPDLLDTNSTFGLEVVKGRFRVTQRKRSPL